MHEEEVGFKPSSLIASNMSRTDPLAPLLEQMAEEEVVKGKRRAIGKLATGWFIAFLMIASISRWFMHRLA